MDIDVIGDKSIDKFRHSEFVNDVLVFIMPEDGNVDCLEAVWCRLVEQVEDHLFKGILLNDLVVNKGLHDTGDVLLILNDNDKLIALPLHEDTDGKYKMRR